MKLVLELFGLLGEGIVLALIISVGIVLIFAPVFIIIGVVRGKKKKQRKLAEMERVKEVAVAQHVRLKELGLDGTRISYYNPIELFGVLAVFDWNKRTLAVFFDMDKEFIYPFSDLESITRLEDRGAVRSVKLMIKGTSPDLEIPLYFKELSHKKEIAAGTVRFAGELSGAVLRALKTAAEPAPVPTPKPAAAPAPAPAKAPAAEEVAKELRTYKGMLDEGLITEEEYARKKAELLR